MLKEDKDTTSSGFTTNTQVAFEKSVKIEVEHNSTAYLFDHLKSEFFNEMLDDASISGESSKKNRIMVV